MTSVGYNRYPNRQTKHGGKCRYGNYFKIQVDIEKSVRKWQESKMPRGSDAGFESPVGN